MNTYELAATILENAVNTPDAETLMEDIKATIRVLHYMDHPKFDASDVCQTVLTTLMQGWVSVEYPDEEGAGIEALIAEERRVGRIETPLDTPSDTGSDTPSGTPSLFDEEGV